MLTDGEIAVFTGILKLHQTACKEFTACDLCPFAIDVPESEVYKCRLRDAFNLLTEYVMSDEE